LPANKGQLPFWKTKSLEEMTTEEWESLCDGCGLCCLEKLEDKYTGTIKYTSVACEYLDMTTCRCLIYENREFINADCIQLNPDKVKQIKWLPETCAYRYIREKQDLKWWHPLVSGNPNTVHRAGISVRFKAMSIQEIYPPGAKPNNRS